MNSFITWIGGKKLLRNKIIEEFPAAATYDRYIEVFGGAGWVLFARDKHASMEVFNDANSELINLYRVVKHHPEALQKELEWILMSREQFLDELHRNLVGMTDIQRAARFFILIKESFGADCHSFGLRSRVMSSTTDYLGLVSKRLDKSIIENRDFEHLIKTYDRATALFYLDPPYYNAEKYYQDRFNREDHNRLMGVLCNIKGKFILSYNDCSEIRELYKAYKIVEVKRQDNLLARTGADKQYRELIIKNY